MRKGLIVLAVLIALTWGSCEVMKARNHLALLPEGLGVTKTVYVSEESWGFGPGGNETGLIVYEMPEAVAEALQDDAKVFLTAISPRGEEGFPGRFSDWQRTPVAEWRYGEAGRLPSEGPSISDYLSQYGYAIPLDREIEAMVNAALAAEDNHYAFGGGAVLLLVPSERKIVFAFAG